MLQELVGVVVAALNVRVSQCGEVGSSSTCMLLIKKTGGA